MAPHNPFESPIGSAARLEALDGLGILDTPPEEAFDGIVRLATRLCETPVGLVSLVAADRQWFKARRNFPPCETDLDRSVCKFALTEPDLLIIPDLTADPRTASNPLVTGEPHIRFYAGAPLRTPEGQVLGSLCVIDTVPRPEGLTVDQSEDLRILAGQVIAQMVMRRALHDRDRALEHQSLRLRQAGRLDLLARASAALLRADDPAAMLEPVLAEGADALGFDRAFLYDVAPGQDHLRLTHAVNATPEVRAQVQRLPFGAPLSGIVAQTRAPLVAENLQASLAPEHARGRETGLNAFAAFPVMSRGALRAVISFASTLEPAFDADAVAMFETIARLMAAVYERQDVEDDLAESAAYWRSLFERLSEGFFVGELIRDAAGTVVDWRYLEANHSFGRLVGMDSRDAIGRTIREVFPGVDEAWIDEFAAVAETGDPTTFLRQAAGSDRWYEGRAFRLGTDRFGVLFLEVSERIGAEARRTAQLALGDRLRDLTSISEMTLAAAEIVGTTLGATRAGYGHVDSAIEFVEIGPDWTAPGVSSIAGRHRFADFGNIREELRRGEPLVIEDVRTDPRTAADPKPMLDLGIVALVNMPVRVRGRTVAVFIVQDSKAHHWSPETLAFLRNVAERLEAGIARVRAEEDQQVLNEEIAHRLKNTLAVVLSIATQTLRDVPDRAPVEAFVNRLHVFSTAHNVLLQRAWTTAAVRTVVRAVTQASGHGDRISEQGPDFELGPRATLALSLSLHELATNAAKYGALSAPEGRVHLRWRIDGEGEAREVVFDWTERGGPPPAPPATTGRKGFGSRLIRLGLTGAGGVDLHFASTGLEATMRAPLAELQSTQEG